MPPSAAYALDLAPHAPAAPRRRARPSARRGRAHAGRPANARATESRRRSPPESPPACRRAIVVEPEAGEQVVRRRRVREVRAHEIDDLANAERRRKAALLRRDPDRRLAPRARAGRGRRARRDRRRAGAARAGARARSSCRRRSGRAARPPRLHATSRSTPSSATVSPKRFVTRRKRSRDHAPPPARDGLHAEVDEHVVDGVRERSPRPARRRGRPPRSRAPVSEVDARSGGRACAGGTARTPSARQRRARPTAPSHAASAASATPRQSSSSKPQRQRGTRRERNDAGRRAAGAARCRRARTNSAGADGRAEEQLDARPRAPDDAARTHAARTKRSPREQPAPGAAQPSADASRPRPCRASDSLTPSRPRNSSVSRS